MVNEIRVRAARVRRENWREQEGSVDDDDDNGDLPAILAELVENQERETVGG